MANTKKLSRQERKDAKRTARRGLKAKVSGLSHAGRKELRKFEGTVTKFFAEKAAKAAKAAAEAPPAAPTA